MPCHGMRDITCFLRIQKANVSYYVSTLKSPRLNAVSFSLYGVCSLGWLWKFFGLVGFAACLSPAFLRIAWFYYTSRRVSSSLGTPPRQKPIWLFAQAYTIGHKMLCFLQLSSFIDIVVLRASANVERARLVVVVRVRRSRGTFATAKRLGTGSTCTCPTVARTRATTSPRSSFTN